jgi:hypothetical protein
MQKGLVLDIDRNNDRQVLVLNRAGVWVRYAYARSAASAREIVAQASRAVVARAALKKIAEAGETWIADIYEIKRLAREALV